ncbi:MAG: TonB-dependent receptor [Pyrinomonadaceae bacterium]|nr:TonB-dependent receptor [Pyrinomonadaceae bacterium]
MNKAFPLLVISLLLLLCPALALGQATASSSAVTGIVTDQTGAVIPGATVKLTDPKTGQERTTTTNDQGVYTFTQVPPGRGYTLTFTNTGFQTLTITEVALGVGITETQNAQMTPGEVGASVTVTSGGETTLNTTDASIGNVIDERRLRELPIQIRNSPAALIGLQPGVVGNNVGTGTANRVGSTTGSRADQGNITVDGIDANDQATGQFASTVGNAPIDSIQEFRAVSTNPNAAEGRSSGGQVELITKSGTNDFSGNVREYNRTSATAANNYFNNSLGRDPVTGNPKVPTPKLIRNQFGGSLGGPIKRDKLFFFQDAEFRKDIQEVSYLRIVPLPHFRAGGLAYIRSGNNNAGQPCPTNARLNGPSPECVVTLTAAQVAALDPRGIGASPALLQFINGRYPLPNDLSAGNGVNTGGFRFNAPSTRNDKTFVTRIDWNATDRQKIFGRFNIARRQQTDTVNTVAAQFPGDPESGQIIVRDYSWAVGHTWAITPAVVNQATVGASRSGLLFPSPFKPTFPNEYTFGSGQSSGTLLSAPFAGIDEQNRFVTTPTIRDDVTWTKGSHTLSFGGVFKPIKNVTGLTNDFNFVSIGLGGLTSTLNASLRPANIGGGSRTTNYDVAFAFLLGRFSSISTNFVYDVNGTPSPPGTGKTRDFRYNEYEAYFQDNWRMRSDLTLTYGTRYQYYSPPYEKNGFQACNDIDYNNLVSIRFRNAANGVGNETSEPFLRYDLCGKGNNAKAFYEPDLNNFAPRIAVAWNPSFKDGFMGSIFGDRKTVVRLGANVQFDRIASAVTFIQDQISYLFDNNATRQFGSPVSATTALLNDPRFGGINVLPIQNVPPTITRPITPFVDAFGFPTGNEESATNYAIAQNFKTPYSIQYSVGFQRELPGNFLIDVSYVGRQGRQLFTQADAAQILDFRDPASGQTLQQAFNLIQAQALEQIRTSVNHTINAATITPQPFFENQINAAAIRFFGGTCQQVFGVTCTRLMVANTASLIPIGDLSDTVSFLQAVGLLNPNVGLSGQFATNAYITNLGSSSYNGMLVSVRRRFAQGLQFDFNYTLSHAIDNQSSIANTVFGGLVCDIRNLRVCRGNSDFDIRHLVNANFIYELPFGKGRMFASDASGVLENIVGGWTVTGIFTARSGLPFNLTTSSFPVGFVFNSPAVITGANPTDLIGQINTTGSGQVQFFQNPTTIFESINPLAGAVRNPFGGEIGNRNVLRGPSFWNVDLAVLKNFKMPWSENHRLQLRWEMYNAFNHTNFALPSTNINSSAGFGLITATANAAREMQFAIRYEF